MTPAQSDRDLIVLVADKDTEFAIKGLFTRRKSLSIRQITADIYPHPQRDPGCARRCHDFLRPFCKQYRQALVVFDLEGSGYPETSREEIEAEVEERLAKSGWQNRAAAIVLGPELEIWVWSDSPEVPNVLGWSSLTPDLGTWLTAEGFLSPGAIKPAKPKEAMEAVLRRSRKRRSSSLYYELAGRVSLKRCTDSTFAKFTATLRRWFPIGSDDAAGRER